MRSRLVVRHGGPRLLPTAGRRPADHPGGAGYAPRHPAQNGDHHGRYVPPGRLPPGHQAAGRVKAPRADQAPCAHRGAGAAGPAADGRSVRLGGVAAGRRDPGPQNVPAVNWALSGQASADSTESGNPASNAIDGDAGTDWCTGAWTGSLVVDLGQVRSLSDLGITLDASSPSASATIKVATQAGDWQAVPAARNVALDPGNPMYVPLPRGTQARYAQLTVYSDTGADVCVGEFRAYGPDPAAAGLDFGADLSFTPQELAAGAQFTYHGQAAEPGHDHEGERRQLRPDAAVGEPARGLQRPGHRPGPGPSGARGRDEDLPGRHVLRFLGRPAAPGHPGRVAGPGPDPAHRDRAVLHPAGDQRVREAGHAGGHGVDRQRDPQRHPVAGRRGERPDHAGGLRQPGHPAQGGRGRGPGREPAGSPAADHDALRPGRQQRASARPSSATWWPRACRST